MKVPKMAEQAMYMHISHAILSGRSNVPEYIVNRFKRYSLNRWSLLNVIVSNNLSARFRSLVTLRRMVAMETFILNTYVMETVLIPQIQIALHGPKSTDV